MTTTTDQLPMRRRARVQRPKLDAASVLTGYMVLLLVVPSDRGIAALGGAGSPSTLYGLGMLLWWVWDRVRNPKTIDSRRLQPVRIGIFAFLACASASYIMAALMPLPYADSNASTMVLINLASYLGVILVANDGVQDRDRFVVLLQRLSILVGAYALVGIVQFFSGTNFVDSIEIPGLASSGIGGVDIRGGFVRSESTARHPLEYAAVLAMALPVALTIGIGDARRSYMGRFVPVGLMFIAAFVSVTRSALLGIAAGLLVLVPTWDKRVQMKALVYGSVGLVAMYFLVPGLGGTIVGMFSGPDASVASRTSSISVALGYLSIEPIFGRGLGTMSPMYRIFDNQYFGLLIEVGVVGTLAFLMLIATAILITFMRRKQPDPLLGAVGPALCGGVLAGSLLCAFFDAFHFPQAVGMLMLMIGLCGTHWNVRPRSLPASVGVKEPGTSMPPTSWLRGTASALRRRWYVVLAALLLTLSAAYMALDVEGVYYTKFDVGFEAPAKATMNNPLRTEPSLVVHFAAMVQRMYEGEHENPRVIPTSAPLYGTGLPEATAVFLPNAGGQWQTNFNRPNITVEIVRTDPAEVAVVAKAVTHELSRLAEGPQDDLGIWKSAQISTVQRPSTIPVQYIAVRTKYALVGIAGLGTALAVSLAVLVDRAVRFSAGRFTRAPERATDAAVPDSVSGPQNEG